MFGNEARLQRSLLFAALALFAWMIVAQRWLAEDAYITLRTVDNFVHGFGLRWNIAERVQSYTHPLWMLLLTPAYAVMRDPRWTAISLGVATTLAAVLLLAFRVARTPVHALTAILLLTLSRSIVEFSTGGFENPLTHLLVGYFAWLYLVRDASCRALAVTAALLAVNRLDTLLIPLPALIECSYRLARERGFGLLVRELAIGLSPLWVWEAFSLVYYGFPFPNTAYVKLGHGVAALDLLKQGGAYLVHRLGWDPMLGVLILLGVLAASLTGRRSHIVLAFGAVLYVVYVVRIGGDFMKGRFLTAPAFTAACLVAASALPIRNLTHVAAVVLPVALLRLAAAHAEPWPEPTLADPYQAGVVHESLGPLDAWIGEGRRLQASGQPTYVVGHVGVVGFFGGPHVHIIDYHALTDALLSHLPPLRNTRWRPGHFRRHVPEGYVETVASGECKLQDRALCAYYERLHLIISGPMFSVDRLSAIVRMNLGAYDHFIDYERYHLHQLAREPLSGLSAHVRDGAPPGSAGTRTLSEAGIDILLERPSHAPQLEVSLDPNNDYVVTFYRADRCLAELPLGARFGEGMAIHRPPTPARASKSGFDRVRIQPARGDGSYHIGHVALRDVD